MNTINKIGLAGSAIFMFFGTVDMVAAKDVVGKRGNNNLCIIVVDGKTGGANCSWSNVSCPNNGLGGECTVTLNGISHTGKTQPMKFRERASDSLKLQ